MRNVAKAPSLGTSSLPHPQESRNPCPAPPPPPHRLHAGPLCWLFPLPGKLSPTSVGLPSICLLTLLPVLGLPSPLEGTWEEMVQGCVHCLSVFTLNCAWPRRDTRKTFEGMNEFLPHNSSFRSQPKCSSLYWPFLMTPSDLSDHHLFSCECFLAYNLSL